MMALLLLACGGGQKEAEAPDTVEPPPPPPEAPMEEPEAEAEAPAAADDASESETQGTTEDIQTVLQLVIDDEALQPMLDLGAPGRFPLKMSGDVPTGVELTKGNEPVQMVQAPESKKDPVLVITKLDVSSKKAWVEFRYDVEKLQGSATLKKGDYGWELINSRVTQH